MLVMMMMMSEVVDAGVAWVVSVTVEVVLVAPVEIRVVVQLDACRVIVQLVVAVASRKAHV